MKKLQRPTDAPARRLSANGARPPGRVKARRVMGAYAIFAILLVGLWWAVSAAFSGRDGQAAMAWFAAIGLGICLISVPLSAVRYFTWAPQGQRSLRGLLRSTLRPPDELVTFDSRWPVEAGCDSWYIGWYQDGPYGEDKARREELRNR